VGHGQDIAQHAQGIDGEPDLAAVAFLGSHEYFVDPQTEPTGEPMPQATVASGPQRSTADGYGSH
jgi:hypothetical protein